MKEQFKFEYSITDNHGLPDGQTEGTWHIYYSDLMGDQSIVKMAIQSQFPDDWEVKLYDEDGTELNDESSHGLFVAYEGGIPV